MRRIALFIVSVVMTVLMVSVVSAQSGIPGSGWWSGQQVQNVGDATANVVIVAYDSQSTNTYQDERQIAPGAAFTFTPLNSFGDMPAGFQGSAIVNANEPIKAIVNVTNQPAANLGVTGGKAAAQYQGTDGLATASTLYFPLAKGDHFGKTTSFYIQNAGSEAATDVVATFTMRNGQVHTYNVPSIGVGQHAVFSVQNSASYAPTENNGRVGSLTVTSTQRLAGVVMEHDTVANPATVLSSTRGFTSADFSDKAYAPVIKSNRFQRFTGLQIQNVSNAPINVTASYVGTSPNCVGVTATDSASNVAPGASVTFVHLGDSTNLQANCTASATITGTGEFVAIVNEQEVPGAANKAGITYSAMSDSAVTERISVPLFKSTRFGATTGLQIQNVGSQPATNWSATFTCVGGATFTAVSDVAKTGAIPAGGAFLFYIPQNQDVFTASNPFVQGNVNCAVIVEANQPIVAIANETPTTPGALDDNNYEGFNIP
jgi:hypothetical protein